MECTIPIYRGSQADRVRASCDPPAQLHCLISCDIGLGELPRLLQRRATVKAEPDTNAAQCCCGIEAAFQYEVMRDNHSSQHDEDDPSPANCYIYGYRPPA
ncbi:unnamed protein product [Cercospora beticola]|nr:unnamed protein product [Cercospora beticola]